MGDAETPISGFPVTCRKVTIHRKGQSMPKFDNLFARADRVKAIWEESRRKVELAASVKQAGSIMQGQKHHAGPEAPCGAQAHGPATAQ